MSFQSMVGGNGGRPQGSPFANQGGWQSQPAAPVAPGNYPSSGYNSEVAHAKIQDSDPYVAEKARVAVDIESITLNLARINEMASQISSPKDTVEHRHQLTRLIEESNTLGKVVQNSMRSLNSLISGNVQERREKKQHIDKLDATFTRFFNTKYAEGVRNAEDLMRRYTPRPASMPQEESTSSHYYSNRNEEDEQVSLIMAQRQQEQVQMQNDAEFQAAQIRHREAAIRALQREMSEVHEVFRDLASLVSEQGDMVNDIQSHIFDASANVDTAAGEVNEAASQQKKGTNKLCIAAIVIAILAAIGVIAAVLAVTLRNKNKS